jgi:hypothetical protein
VLNAVRNNPARLIATRFFHLVWRTIASSLSEKDFSDQISAVGNLHIAVIAAYYFLTDSYDIGQETDFTPVSANNNWPLVG